MGSKAKKVVRKVSKKILPDKVEKAALGPTEADLVAAAFNKPDTKEAEAAEADEKERAVEMSSREERERASRRRSRRMGRRQLLSYGRLGAPIEDETQRRTLG